MTTDSFMNTIMPSPPDWLDDIVREVSSWLQAHEEVPVGCHIHEADDCWEVSLFLMRVEVLGGARDGERVTLPFHLDLTGLPDLLDELETLSWQTARLGAEDDVGPSISVVGTCGGKRVWIRILAEAPRITPTVGRLCARTLELHEF
jgi:hypothetical protein